MGANASNAKYGKDKEKSRGSVDNAGRLEAFASGVKSGSAEWASCDAERLQAVVVAITGLGGAVTFGLSRDEGAHSVTLMLDGSRKTLWFNGNAAVNEELDEVLNTLASITRSS